MAVGLGSGLESLGPCPHTGPSTGQEGVAGSPRTGQKSSGSRQVFGFGAFISCPFKTDPGARCGQETRQRVAINNTDRWSSPPDR